MANTYTWEITDIHATSSGGVYNIFLTCTGSDGTNEFVYETQYGPEPNESSDGYIQYEDLTNDIVMGWVNNALRIDKIEEYIGSELTNMAQNQPRTGKPWE